MRAVLLAAGRGTRMGELTRATPKPLLPLAGKPILAHIVDGMIAAGIREFVIVTGYLGEQIEAAFGDGSDRGVAITYRRQERTDGTAGALLLARDLLGEAPFMLSWGDILVEPALYSGMVQRFAAAPCDVLLSVNPVDDPWRGAAVYVDGDGRVERIIEKPPRGSSSTGWNNAGVFVFSPLILDYAARLEPSPRGEYELPQAIARMLDDGREVRAIPVGALWSDVGTPEDLRAVDALLRERQGGEERQRARTARLIEAFRRRFGAAPEAIVSAPGRVNLLGEHTDYNGLPVLPMAIDRAVLMAVRGAPAAEIELDNLDPRFAPRTYAVDADIPPYADGDWGNYHKAAVQGLVRHLQNRHSAWAGGAYLADGDVPSGAGLSSSSALVVASGLAFLAANRIDMPPAELAELLARAERYVGTLSGGMDQAASLLGRAGHAVRIDFFPLRVQPVPLPAGVAVLVCHSLVQAEKSAGARDAYNTRVIECRLACEAMARALSLPRRAAEGQREGAAALRRLGDLVELYPGRPLPSFIEPLAAILPVGDASLAAVADAIGVPADELRRRCEIPAAMPDRFAPLPRARHVLSEADRVGAGVAALRRGDVQEFGRLMVASHASCRDDYRVSCPELDDLVEVALAAGALGSRLTGAGFGGCTVSLVRAEEVDAVLAAVDRDFYRPRLGAGGDASGHRFVFTAHQGASVARLA